MDEFERSTMKTVGHISETRDIRIMGDHDDGIVCFSMEIGDEVHDFFGIGFVEISCRLISKKIWNSRNKCSCDRHSLCLTS